MYNVWKFLARTLSALNMAGILHVWPHLIDHDATSWKTPVIWNYGIIVGLSVNPTTACVMIKLIYLLTIPGPLFSVLCCESLKCTRWFKYDRD